MNGLKARTFLLWPDGGAEGVRTPDLLNAIQHTSVENADHHCAMN